MAYRYRDEDTPLFLYCLFTYSLVGISMEQRNTRVVKAVWYVALGLTLLTSDVKADTIVIYICFIEACDLIFQQLEIERERNKNRR